MKLKMAYDDFSKSRVQLTDFGPTMAKQSFKEEADINTIVKRFGLTGELPKNFRTPTYGDFTQVTDFQSAVNAVRAAGESFMEMPAELRAKFLNDPQKLIEFVSKEDNRAEAIKLGLVPKPVEVVPPTPPAPVVTAVSSPAAPVVPLPPKLDQ